MKRKFQSLFAIVAAACFACSALATAADDGLKYNDGTADGRRSIGGSGEMIHFTLPKDGQKIAGLRIHGSRYGSPKAPDEKFMIFFLSPDESEIFNTQLAPYSLFDVGEEKWVDVKFAHPVEVPKDFWVSLDFHATQNKGIFVSFDKSTEGKHSKMGLPGMEHRDVDFGGDWMIELVPAK